MSIEVPKTSIEVTAPSVDEAIILGLTRLGLTRDDVDITVLEEANKGFLGIGARLAKVRLTQREQEPIAPTTPEEPKPEPVSEPVVVEEAKVEPEPVVGSSKKAQDTIAVSSSTEPEPTHSVKTSPPKTTETVVEEPVPTASSAPKPQDEPADNGKLDRAAVESVALDVAEHLFPDLSINISTDWQREDRPTLWVCLQGADADMLVGPRAQTLNSVQYLFRTLIHHQVDGEYNIVVDADGYRKRRRNSLESLARKKADQAINTGRTIRLRPMPAGERRLIHMLLRKDKRVKTESVGHGSSRAITIIPVNKKSR